MLANARLLVDLPKITENVRYLVERLHGIDIVAVTKGVCGSPAIARAMLAGGAVALADSRHENAQRLRDDGISAPLWLLRTPTPGRAADTVRLFDYSLISEVETCAALDAAAAELGATHRLVVMVELGDLRAGILPADLPAFVEAVERLEHVELAGIGTNLTCYGAIVPDEQNMSQLLDLARSTERHGGRRLRVSGGNSGSLPMALEGRMPSGVSSLRVGETALHGVDTLTRRPIPGLHTDAFTVEAPVIECKVKPSLPTGTIAQNAWGDVPVFEDRGVRRRAICALGRQDCHIEGLTPLDPRVLVLGASSDHLLLDVDDMVDPPGIGEMLAFRPDYAATLRLCTSPFVDKVIRGGRGAAAV